MTTGRPTADNRRIAKRVPIALSTRLRYSGQQQGDIIIRDLSFTGFKCETAVPLKPGDLISVALPNIGLVRATVQWRDGVNLAAKFHSAVDVRACFRT